MSEMKTGYKITDEKDTPKLASDGQLYDIN
jgi:hypothetical protein